MAEGTFICYESKKFNEEHLEIIAKANAIIADSQYPMSLRQVYYQFVTKNWLKNKQSEYSRLGGILSDGRIAGLVSWEAMEDRERQLMGRNTWDSIPSFLRGMKPKFALDLWANQDWRPEVWIEKKSLINTVAGICHDLRVDYFATKGYNSQSEQWRAGRRMARYVHKGQRPIVFHLGDHDPSGFDMTRDNQERLSMFAGVPIMVVRLALNRNQVEKFDLPENPVKFTDSRAHKYIGEHGYHSWELDAISPSYISDMIRENIDRLRDMERWDEMLEEETNDRMVLDRMIDNFGGQ